MLSTTNNIFVFSLKVISVFSVADFEVIKYYDSNSYTTICF